MKRTRHLRKIFAFCLAVLMLAQLSCSVMAASVTWTNTSGVTYIATVTKGTGTTTRTVNVTSSSTHHTRGKATIISPGTRTVQCSGDMNFPSPYSGKLYSAASSAGLSNSYSGSVYFGFTTTIPAGRVSGYYCIRTSVVGNQGTYRVDRVDDSATTMEKSGSFSFAPYACSGANSGIYCISVDDSEIS